MDKVNEETLSDQPFEIHRLELGKMQNFIYLIKDRRSRQAAVLDPAWNTSEVLKLADQQGVEISDVLISHWHEDHINGLYPLARERVLRVHVAQAEVEFWNPQVPGQPILHQDGDRILVGDTTIEVVLTPGHSPGSVCYAVDGYLFTGDTLFVFGCGRCDLPGGDARQMFYSLSRLQKQFSKETVVLPGHHYARQESSTLGEQIWGNPFLHFNNADDFAEFRAHHNEHRHPPYEPVPRGTRIW